MSQTALRRIFVCTFGLTVGLAIGGCAGTVAAPTWTFAPGHTQAVPAAVAVSHGAAAMTGMAAMADQGRTATTQSYAVAPAPGQPSGPIAGLNLTIVTGDMIGHTEYPAYVPSSFSLPANSTVVVTITNFDDATPLAKGMERYATVSGTVGATMAVTPIDVRSPNSSSGPLRVLTGLDPAAVSHTFTIPALGINVPVAAHARTVFTIHTGAPGTYFWRCFDPCGAGGTGWGTAMAAKSGFMEGTLTIV
jgi:hypothetical protein